MLLLACAAWPLAHAQAIYRCGDSYSQQPCAGGSQLAPAAPAPSAAERAQAAAAAARDARLADTLEKDRTRRDAQASSAAVVLPATAGAEPEPHLWPEKAATRKLDVFTASAPGSKPAKAKAPSKARTAEATAKPSAKTRDGAVKPGTVQPQRVPVKTAKPAGAA
jgi:hypothetical protein